MKLIEGQSIAATIRSQLQNEIQQFKTRKPGLAFILVGHHAPSHTYVKMKKKHCLEVGIDSYIIQLDETASEKDLINHIQTLNQASHIDGILIQQPLPKHFNLETVLHAVDPSKDVDGLHPMNMGKLLLGEQGGFIPCTPLGIVQLLHRSHIQVAGKHVVIIGRSHLVGKPLAALLVQKSPLGNATVTLTHTQTKDLPAICRQADILVAAIGHPHFVTSEMIPKGGVIIDVGINRIQNSKGKWHLVGDVSFDEVKNQCVALTPVPGGVGPMTIAMLLVNTLLSYQRKQPC